MVQKLAPKWALTARIWITTMAPPHKADLNESAKQRKKEMGIRYRQGVPKMMPDNFPRRGWESSLELSGEFPTLPQKLRTMLKMPAYAKIFRLVSQLVTEPLQRPRHRRALSLPTTPGGPPKSPNPPEELSGKLFRNTLSGTGWPHLWRTHSGGGGGRTCNQMLQSSRDAAPGGGRLPRELWSKREHRRGVCVCGGGGGRAKGAGRRPTNTQERRRRTALGSSEGQEG